MYIGVFFGWKNTLLSCVPFFPSIIIHSAAGLVTQSAKLQNHILEFRQRQKCIPRLLSEMILKDAEDLNVGAQMSESVRPTVMLSLTCQNKWKRATWALLLHFTHFFLLV
ncbi:hypothetical protein XENORESO_016212 [Xenotaenia resolanae]|uniref:Uncharacterized protein n=1 Tax=Xenotaenia resolanae TaxID=208358 RepID=A0ABV0W3T3_9TELE